MRVALISHLASPGSPTGAERVLTELVAGLRERGHEVAAAAPGRGAAGEELARRGIPLEVLALRRCWLTQPEPQPALWDALRLARWAAPGGGRRRLQAWLRAVRPDVVHVNCLPNLDAAAAARALALPVVWHVHEIVARGWRRSFFVRHLRRSASRVVAVSRAVAAWIRAADEGLEVAVVHNGVAAPPLPDRRAARRALGLDPEAVWVGFFSQLIPHKGAEVLLAAMETVVQQVADVRLLVMAPGAGGTADATAQAAARPRLAGRLTCLPGRPEVWEALAAMDVVAVPSVAADPLPRVVMEAMAAGLPVVGSAVGGIPEMIDDGVTGRLVAPGDAGELAQALVALAAAPGLRAQMADAARRSAARRFTPAAFLDGIEAELEHAVGVRR